MRHLQSPCPKCNNGTGGIHYRYKRALPFRDEHIQAFCANCHYKWKVTPSDRVHENLSGGLKVTTVIHWNNVVKVVATTTLTAPLICLPISLGLTRIHWLSACAAASIGGFLALVVGFVLSSALMDHWPCWHFKG